MAADYSNFNDDADKWGVILHHIDLHRNPLHPKNIKAFRQMDALIKAEGFDVIHCNTPIGGLLGRICGAKNKVRKIIYTVHGFHFYKGAPLVNRIIYKPMEKFLSKKTDAIITINTEDFAAAKNFKFRCDDSVFYVPGVGIDTERFETDDKEIRAAKRQELGVLDDEVLLISAGELNQNKNNAVIIDALSKINCEELKIKYFLCGVGPLEEALKQKAEEYGLSDRVVFLGYRNDLPDLLKAADVFLMPSFREGLSRSIMEAMASALPCIVSSIRGNVDLIEEKGGALCSPFSADEFAKAIESLCKDSDKRAEMGAFNREKSAIYKSESIREKIAEIFNKVI
jgi:glycosyltransferase involved in cell wall biosynthesis